MFDRAIELDEYLLAQEGSNRLVDVGEARKAPEPLAHAGAGARGEQRPRNDHEPVQRHLSPRQRRCVARMAQHLRKPIRFVVERGSELFAAAGAIEGFPEAAPRPGAREQTEARGFCSLVEGGCSFRGGQPRGEWSASQPPAIGKPAPLDLKPVH